NVVVLESLDVLVSQGASIGQYPQLRSKLRCLHFPIVNERCWHHQQTGAGAVLLFRLQQSQRLYGLTQSHVIGKATTKSVFVKEPKPVISRPLVRTKFTLEILGHGVLFDPAE